MSNYCCSVNWKFHEQDLKYIDFGDAQWDSIKKDTGAVYQCAQVKSAETIQKDQKWA